MNSYFPEINDSKITYLSLTNIEGEYRLFVNVGFFKNRTKLFEKSCCNKKYYADMVFEVNEDVAECIIKLVDELDYELITKDNIESMCKVK